MAAVVLDAIAAAAIDLAREAAETDAPEGTVGAHLGVAADAEGVVSHQFECLSSAYPGWRWSVTLIRAMDAQELTIAEVLLMPGPESLIAPAWVPWADRVQPGDLGVGDVLPHRVADPALVPGYTNLDDLEGVSSQSPLQPSQWELGLGRARVLSADALLEAANRWAEGDRGSQSSMAISAPGACSSCGYLVTIGGPLGQAFGLCAQELSPADGQVVALDFGCGAHSEATAVEPEPEEIRVDLDLVDLRTYEPPIIEEPVVEALVNEALVNEELVNEELVNEVVDAEAEVIEAEAVTEDDSAKSESE
ncbi:unannotated protein [freshwater metagenome]|uniref:Unannotated protein n=1 Tax=freshwater metagenome TaxID=449393 RepID=A0A6J7GZE3_9ZZZZ|nr:DUF3027 domain-containing protein [Actinomycetota bacterium]